MAHCMQSLLPQRTAGLARPRRNRVAVNAQVKTIERPSSSTQATDIYIGKGRFIKDDPKKYPGRESLGVFTGATGGWAGGETALWELREGLQNSKPQKSDSSSAASKPTPPKVSGQGKAAIYIGKSKGATEPRYIVDDPRKYPGKEDVAFLPGATGGFAGGEAGLKQFVETGELSLRPPSLPAANTQYSPLTTAVLLILAGGGGGALLLLGAQALNLI